MAGHELEKLRQRLLVGDTVAVAWAVAGAHLTVHGRPGGLGDQPVWRFQPAFLAASLAVGTAWVLLLWLGETRHPVVLGAAPRSTAGSWPPPSASSPSWPSCRT